MPFLKSILLALSLAIDVFAVSLGIGMRPIDRAARLRFALAFLTAELSMLLIGMAIGKLVMALLGDFAGYIGFIALIGIGGYVLYHAHKEQPQAPDLSRGWTLFLSALSISFDSLGIGFSILFIGVPVGLTIASIGICTLLATWLGFLMGKRLGVAFEERAEVAAGGLLVATGLIFIALKATGHG